VILEQTATHPFLADFYADMERFKLETELGFVLLHYHQLHVRPPSAVAVTDFSPAKDVIFARMNLEGEDLHLFEDVYHRLSGRLELPALAVVLQLPVDVLAHRVRSRGRSYEGNIPLEYLRRLDEFYGRYSELLASEVRLLPVDLRQSREDVGSAAAAIVRAALSV